MDRNLSWATARSLSKTCRPAAAIRQGKVEARRLSYRRKNHAKELRLTTKHQTYVRPMTSARWKKLPFYRFYMLREGCSGAGSLVQY